VAFFMVWCDVLLYLRCGGGMVYLVLLRDG